MATLKSSPSFFSASLRVTIRVHFGKPPTEALLQHQERKKYPAEGKERSQKKAKPTEDRTPLRTETTHVSAQLHSW